MNPTTSAIRAVTGAYMQQLARGYLIRGIIVFVVFVAGIAYLASSISGWWWLFLVVIVPLGLAAMAILIGIWIFSRRILPRPLTKTETATAARFGQRVFRIVERGRMPYPLLIASVTKDVIRGKGSGLLRSAVDDTAALKDDFTRIRSMFL